MAEKKNAKQMPPPEGQRAQCHFISNTHWDREWRFSAQRTRYMLVYMLDMVFDLFEKAPGFRYFHLDSQTLPLQDYLEARPDREALVRKYIEEGRLLVGPWYVLPDEFCVGGESLVRNLLLGHQQARQFGEPSKTGYSPFSWGQISQMPQIYQGFGIDTASFYRGINSKVSPRSEFIWEGPDGSRLLGSRLAKRPRYNVWYVIQRQVYWGMEDVDERDLAWKNGNGPFRFIDPQGAELDYQYVHPAFNYFEDRVGPAAEQAMAEQDGEWTTPHRFWSCGHDSSCPDIREVRMMEDCDAALGGRADVYHSTFAAFQDGLRAADHSDWPVAKGEMRHEYTKGSSSNLFGWVTSARMPVKQDNFRTEQLLTYTTEPAAVFAAFLGARYPREFIGLAYNWLLQNQGHDSIGGCSRDIIHEDMAYRYRQAREICGCVFERALMDIAGSVDLSDHAAEDVALVVFNPTPFARTEVFDAIIEIPEEYSGKSFDVVDEKGNALPLQHEYAAPSMAPVVQSPNDVANTMPAQRHYVRVAFPEVPAMGYRTFFAVPNERTWELRQPATLRTAAQTMENEFLRVTINANGTLDVFDKRTKETYAGQGFFRDSGDVGDPWHLIPPERDAVFTTLGAQALVSVERDGALECSFRVRIDWALPQGRSKDDNARSEVLKPFPIESVVTLRKGQAWVEIETTVDNTVEDHYLQAAFPTGVETDRLDVQGQFDVVERSFKTPNFDEFDDPPQAEFPMNSFVDASDGKRGLAILNDGLKAYIADEDPARTVRMTLLRCFPLRIIATSRMIDYSQTDKGSQCPGRHTFRYALMPHKGGWSEGAVWNAATQFTTPLRACQVGPTKHGTEPLAKSFLELKAEGLHVSAVKESESGEGWIVRLFNPAGRSRKGQIRLNGGYTGPEAAQSPVERVQQEFALPQGRGSKWRTVRTTTLEEIPQKDLEVDSGGWASFSIGKKQILTIEFVK